MKGWSLQSFHSWLLLISWNEGCYPGLEKSSDSISSLFAPFSRTDHLFLASLSDPGKCGKAAYSWHTFHHPLHDQQSYGLHHTQQKQNTACIYSAASSILVAATIFKVQPTAVTQDKWQKTVLSHTWIKKVNLSCCLLLSTYLFTSIPVCILGHLTLKTWTVIFNPSFPLCARD